MPANETAPSLPKQAPHPSGPVALLHGIAFNDEHFVAIEESRDFREQFGDDATIRTACTFIDAWGREVHEAWLAAVEAWRELREETADVDAYESRDMGGA